MKFGIATVSGLERFRENTASARPISLRRKRCSCGKVITAKQQTQQGGCDACARQGTEARKAA